MTNTGFSTTKQGPIPFGLALPQPADRAHGPGAPG